jgi:acetyl esterase/lipase
VAGVIGLSALLELDGTARSTHTEVDNDAFGGSLVLPTIIEHVYAQLAPANDASPINGAVELMPPSLLIAAETEILRCDAERLHAGLIKSERPSTLQIWAKQIHAFPAVMPFLPESRQAFVEVAQFITSCVSDANAISNDEDQAV